MAGGLHMIIYHGSDHLIKNPEYGKGELRNDYGRGFYCTENIELAKEWGASQGEDGFANIYEFDNAKLKILNLNSEEYDVLTWLAVLAKHRTYWQRHSIAEEAKNYLNDYFLVDVNKYDVIIGYRADDSYFSFAQDFISGAISLRKLCMAMKLGKLGEQIVLKSKLSFERIKYIGNEDAPASIYYEKKVQRDKLARKKYREHRITDDSIDDIYIIDIMREGMKPGDERLKWK